MRLAAAFLVLAACGRLGFAPIDAVRGDGGDDGTGSNTPTDALQIGMFAPTTETYIKASNTNAADFFGDPVAVSADGSVIVTGAIGEASNATGVDGDQSNNAKGSSGAAYVYVNTAGTWAQQTYLKASNTDAMDQFGFAVAISGDGTTIAIGANQEASDTQGVSGVGQADNSAPASGAVYVFVRSGATWVQQAYLKASSSRTDDRFGYSVALSYDGNTLAVGAPGETSNATGIGGNQADQSDINAGAVYVFTRTGGTTWLQQAYVKASNTDAGDDFGWGLSISGDGNTLAVGAWGESSAATGVGGNQASNAAMHAGASYVFSRAGTTWTQQAYVKASNTDVGDEFGIAVAISADGATLAVGAPYEASNSTGINGVETDNSYVQAGAVYVFARAGTTWSQQAYVKASNTDASDAFGTTVSLAADGSTLAVGAALEDSDATGIDGDQSNNALADAGAAYVFARAGTTWSQIAYLKSTFPNFDELGYSVAIAEDATELVVGAPFESSSTIGIGGDPSNVAASDSGALYVFR